MAVTSNSTAASLINGVIYDSENGKTCHQCRQKRRSFAAACKNHRNDKPCRMVFCQKCLLNRYGEKAEEVQVMEQWSCPKCRGICNCSFCRKKQGHLPTGILCHKAKAKGYCSVSELLHANGPENFGIVKEVKVTSASSRKRSASGKEIASPKKKGKENSFHGMLDMNLESLVPVKAKELEKKQGGTLKNDNLSKFNSCPDKKPKKTKQGTLKTVHDGQNAAAALTGCGSGASLTINPNKSQVSGASKHNDGKPYEEVDDLNLGNCCMTKVSAEVPADSLRNKKRHVDNDIEESDSERTKKREKHNTGVLSAKDTRMQFQSQDVGADIQLPHGTNLITIDGVELLHENVGNALQFLEFCAAFGKTLNMKKGQSNIILRELLNGQQSRILRRTEQNSPVVHFHIQLLSLLQKEYDLRPQKLSPSNGKNSWLLALKNCLSDSPNAIDSLPTDCLDKEASGYNTLDSSTKLRIITFLCDEVLETAKIRDWINEQELKYAKKAKQAKEKVLAAKDKEKSLKQKVMDELAKAITAKDGCPLSISEHDEIVHRIKCEADQAHKETLEAMNMVPKAKERAKALRTEPTFLDVQGRAFWRLNGYSGKSNILVQDIGNGDDSAVFSEKWIAFDDEQEVLVEKHISFRGVNVV